MDFHLREATQRDEPFLQEMLYEALFVAPGDPPMPRSVVDHPDLSRYVRGFGGRRGDVGLIAQTSAGDPIGAAWVRRLPSDDPGHGFVDDETPELSVAVVAAWRGFGVGTALLARLLDSTPRCSLSVDDRNRAVILYERFGFEIVSSKGHSLTMLRASD
jgi:ribosomal protein S18 acetylase RimI-like enzyme